MNGFKCTIVPADGLVMINGRPIHLPDAQLKDNPDYAMIQAVQFDGDQGEIEFRGKIGRDMPNAPIQDLSAFQDEIKAAKRIIQDEDAKKALENGQ